MRGGIESRLAKAQGLRYSARVTETSLFLEPLSLIHGVRAKWVERLPKVKVNGDRNEAMRALRPSHEAIVQKFGGLGSAWWRAEQVHGHAVAVVPGAGTIEASDGLSIVPNVDGLVTDQPRTVLAIYVADCGPIWLADRKTGAIGVLHSGKKGTEGNILASGVETMERHFGANRENIVAVLGPCIRPPHYEIDFAKEIGRQAQRLELADFRDCGLDTAADLRRFYSYRMEKGRTGRMMALITRDP